MQEYIFFHKQDDSKKIPQKLPMLILNNTTLERVNSIKFLGVILDENINWNWHIKLVENKILKSNGILYRASLYLDKESLKSIYFSFINSYISYCNIAWASTSKTKLTRIFNKQKHALRIIYNKSIYVQLKQPGRFPGIAGNAENHGNDGKFHESHQILNQI